MILMTKSKIALGNVNNRMNTLIWQWRQRKKGYKYIFISSELAIQNLPQARVLFWSHRKNCKKVTEGKVIFSYSYFRLDALLWIAAIFVAVFCLTITTYFVAYRNRILVMSFSYASRNRSNEYLLIFPEYLFWPLFTHPE